MKTVASKLAIATLAIVIAGLSVTAPATFAEAGPRKIASLSGTDLGSGR